MSPPQSVCHRCSHCSREFVRAEHLVRHERIHTKEKPFQCKLCDQSFSRTDLLRRHEKKVHPARMPSGRISRHSDSSPRPREIRIPGTPPCGFDMDNVNLAATWPFDGEQAVSDLSETDIALSLAENLLPDDLFWLNQLQIPAMTADVYEVCDVLPQSTTEQSILSRPGSPPLQSIPTEPVHTVEAGATAIPGISQERWNAIQERLSACGHNASLPSPFNLSQVVRRYFESFHRHQPFVHRATWSFETARTSLILAMATSGALYSLESEMAENLYQAAVASLKSEETGLWTLQTLMILTACQAWSGQPEHLQTALGFYGEMTILIRREWARVASASEFESWESWCERESLKRITYCIFTLMTLINIAYDVPSTVYLEDRFGMPCHESQWTARSANEWANLGFGSAAFTSPLSAAAVADQLLSDKEQQPPSQISAFGCHIIISCLVQRIILLRKAFPELVDDHCREAYSKFLRALRRWQRMWEREPSASLSPSSPHGPMLFNSTALLRLAYMRLVSDYSPIRNEFSWCNSAPSIEGVIQHIGSPTRRSDATRAALHACLALRVPAQLGFNVVARTSFWVWSVQHAVCYFECALVLSRWLLCFTAEDAAPIAPDEWKVIDLVQQVLNIPSATRDIPSEAALKEMSSAVLHRWSQLLDTRETTVWGLIPKLSHVLRLHAEHINP
ncbi:hypothetical protein BJX64DRAFT_261938 [Aspergillus heterothallicus]